MTASRRDALACWAAALALCGAGRGAHSSEIEGQLASAENSIIVEADDQAPRLRSLQGRGTPPWNNRANETLPDRVTVRGVSQPVAWRLDRTSSRLDAREVQLTYVADSPHMELRWLWLARSGHGPLEHRMVLTNLSDEPVILPLLPSFRFDWEIGAAAVESFSVEKGADTPSAAGTHREVLRDGDTWSGESSTYARPRPNQPREIIPYVLMEEAGGNGRGWYVGIESSARTRITVRRDGSSLHGEAGLNGSPEHFQTRLEPGGTFETPTIFLGASEGGPDAAGNVLRRWVRAVLSNPATLKDERFPLTTSNSWGSGMAVDEPLARHMIQDSAQLGLELFHLDAGWFRDVGDWHADEGKFPHGIAPVADFAHQHGLKFGLWMAWTQAGTSTHPGALNVHDPVTRGWLIADPPDGWEHREPYKGITLDLGVPAAQRWVAAELERVVRDYHLDMLEHDGYLLAQGTARTDHPAVAPDPATLDIYEHSGFLWADGSNDTDVSYHATRAYYELYRELRARHPALLLEVCNDGGRMVDFGSAAHGDYFSITDTYDPLSNRRAFYDASHLLPSAMLESYVEKWPTPRIENLRYQLRSGMLGWFSLMLDTRDWNAEQRTEARRQIALYKSSLRPLIRDADLYHVSTRPDGVGWDGIEYYSTSRRRGVLYAFRGTTPDQSTHRFRLRGLDPKSSYRLRFQDRGASARRVVAGRVLMESGFDVMLSVPLSSELVFIEEIS